MYIESKYIKNNTNIHIENNTNVLAKIIKKYKELYKYLCEDQKTIKNMQASMQQHEQV